MIIAVLILSISYSTTTYGTTNTDDATVTIPVGASNHVPLWRCLDFTGSAHISITYTTLAVTQLIIIHSCCLVSLQTLH